MRRAACAAEAGGRFGLPRPAWLLAYAGAADLKGRDRFGAIFNYSIGVS